METPDGRSDQYDWAALSDLGGLDGSAVETSARAETDGRGWTFERSLAASTLCAACSPAAGMTISLVSGRPLIVSYGEDINSAIVAGAPV